MWSALKNLEKKTVKSLKGYYQIYLRFLILETQKISNQESY